MVRLLLLHGFTGSPASWQAVVERLPDGFEAFTPHLSGHGWRTGVPDDFYGEVDRLVGWLYARTTPPLVVAGYSMGGRLALGLLKIHRRLFRAAVLIGAHPGIVDEAERRARAQRDDELARLLEERGIEEFVDRWQAQPLFATQSRLPAAVLERQRAERLQHRPEALALALRKLGPAAMPDLRPELPTFDLPVELLAGERDDKFVAAAREMAGQLPRAAVEIVPDAGHNLILEAPAAVARAIARAAGRAAKETEP